MLFHVVIEYDVASPHLRTLQAQIVVNATDGTEATSKALRILRRRLHGVPFVVTTTEAYVYPINGAYDSPIHSDN